jgi:hypothetical protein
VQAPPPLAYAAYPYGYAPGYVDYPPGLVRPGLRLWPERGHEGRLGLGAAAASSLSASPLASSPVIPHHVAGRRCRKECWCGRLAIRSHGERQQREIGTQQASNDCDCFEIGAHGTSPSGVMPTMPEAGCLRCALDHSQSLSVVPRLSREHAPHIRLCVVALFPAWLLSGFRVATVDGVWSDGWKTPWITDTSFLSWLSLN